jgi:hypothetical protein
VVDILEHGTYTPALHSVFSALYEADGEGGGGVILPHSSQNFTSLLLQHFSTIYPPPPPTPVLSLSLSVLNVRAPRPPPCLLPRAEVLILLRGCWGNCLVPGGSMNSCQVPWQPPPTLPASASSSRLFGQPPALTRCPEVEWGGDGGEDRKERREERQEGGRSMWRRW